MSQTSWWVLKTCKSSFKSPERWNCFSNTPGFVDVKTSVKYKIFRHPIENYPRVGIGHVSDDISKERSYHLKYSSKTRFEGDLQAKKRFLFKCKVKTDEFHSNMQEIFFSLQGSYCDFVMLVSFGESFADKDNIY